MLKQREMYLVTYNMPGDKRRPTLFADMKAVEDYMNKIAENNPNQNMAWMNVQKIVKFFNPESPSDRRYYERKFNETIEGEPVEFETED